MIKINPLKEINLGVAKTGKAGGGGYSYNGLYGEASPERCTFFRLQISDSVGVLLVEVYERIGNSVIWVFKKALKD